MICVTSCESASSLKVGARRPDLGPSAPISYPDRGGAPSDPRHPPLSARRMSRFRVSPRPALVRIETRSELAREHRCSRSHRVCAIGTFAPPPFSRRSSGTFGRQPGRELQAYRERKTPRQLVEQDIPGAGLHPAPSSAFESPTGCGDLLAPQKKICAELIPLDRSTPTERLARLLHGRFAKCTSRST